MATLSGKKVKDTYQGLLKTSDQAALSGTFKVVQDGSGNDSALSLSTAKVKAENLQLNSPSTSTSTNVLVWDSSTKDVGYKVFSTFDSVTVTIDGGSSPDITITDNNSNSTTVELRAGTNLEATQSGDTITFSYARKDVTSIAGPKGINANGSGKATLLDASGINGGDVQLPSASAGLYLEFYISVESTTAFKIKTATGDKMYGKAVVLSTTDDNFTTDFQAKSGSRTVVSIDSNSATTGGKVGDMITCLAVDDEFWLVNANLTTTSANPGSASVFKNS